MCCFYPDYRVYKSRSEFSGSDVFEFFPGEFAGEVSFGNAGSVYVREESLAPFARMLHAVAPEFPWYGSETRLDRRQTAIFLRLLDLTSAAVMRACTMAHLRAIDSHILGAPACFLVRKAQLTRMTADLAAVADRALRRRVGLWVLGP